MKNTKAMSHYGSEKTNLTLSDVAQKVYSETDPLDIYEEETGNGFRYSIRGCLGDYDEMTEAKINELLQDIVTEDEIREYGTNN